MKEAREKESVGRREGGRKKSKAGEKGEKKNIT
jgi:hypothetical protein